MSRTVRRKHTYWFYFRRWWWIVTEVGAVGPMTRKRALYWAATCPDPYWLVRSRRPPPGTPL